MLVVLENTLNPELLERCMDALVAVLHADGLSAVAAAERQQSAELVDTLEAENADHRTAMGNVTATAAILAPARLATQALLSAGLLVSGSAGVSALGHHHVRLATQALLSAGLLDSVQSILAAAADQLGHSATLQVMPVPSKGLL